MYNKNTTITIEDFGDMINDVKTRCENANLDISNLVSTSNSLYTMSSIYEDCILEKYLNVYNLVKNIQFNKKLSNIFIESFISESYIDKDFKVDNKLNVDILNGDATLPIDQTEDISVSSIIINSTSNGNIGSSIAALPYDDINDILSTDSSKLFIYEKTVSILSVNELKLDLALKFEKTEVCNGLYIQLYNDSNIKYPTINSVKISNDGINYIDVEFTNLELDKADRYIRFEPQYVRYISVSFSQTTYDSLSTKFGSRYRYSIGIRQINPKRTLYKESGEYVSIPLSVPNNTNSMYFSASDISNSDVLYFASANGGSKWMSLKSDDINVLDNTKLGLNAVDAIENLRIKILMDKSKIKLNIKNNTEFSPWSTANKYYLKNTPLDIKGYLGNFISYGNKFPYSLNIPNTLFNSDTLGSDTYTVILNNVPYDSVIFTTAGTATYVNNITMELNGSLLDPLSYTIEKDEYKNNCVLKMKSDKIVQGTLLIYYKPLVYEGKKGNTLELPQPLFVRDNSAIFIQPIDTNGITLAQLADDEFEILSDTSIKIKDTSYNNTYNYKVLYSPSVEIKESITTNANEVSISSIKKMDTYPQIRFDYTYESDADIMLEKYYTPLCKSYRIEYI